MFFLMNADVLEDVEIREGREKETSEKMLLASADQRKSGIQPQTKMC